MRWDLHHWSIALQTEFKYLPLQQSREYFGRGLLLVAIGLQTRHILSQSWNNSKLSSLPKLHLDGFNTLARELVDAIHFPALWVLQQPRKHSHSLQLANHTQLAHHYIQWALSTLSVSKRISSKYRQAHQSTARPQATSKWHCLFQLLPWENVNRSTTLIYRTWVTSSH